MSESVRLIGVKVPVGDIFVYRKKITEHDRRVKKGLKSIKNESESSTKQKKNVSNVGRATGGGNSED